MMHQATFRRRVHSLLPAYEGTQMRDKLSIILNAMIAGALHLIDADKLPPSLSADPTKIQTTIEKARRRVVVEATSELSVENLQALVIIAFTDVS